MIAKRLCQARLVAGMTQQEVVDQLSKLGARLTKAGLSKYERGGSVPNAALLLMLARVLRVKADYFLKEDIVTVQWLAFRSHATLGKRGQERIRAFAENIVEGQVWLQECLLPGQRPVFPRRCRAETAADAEEAATRLRQKWGLGDCPVGSVTKIVEENGGIVVDCPIAPGEFDGLSGLVNRKYPVAVLSGEVPDDRRRFNLAHELGHLTMDCTGLDRREENKLAHRFAAAFIVPAAVARRELGNRRRRLDLNELGLLKKRHGLSMQAWIRRAFDLGIITRSHYNTLMVEFSERGWRRREPVEFEAREEPMRLRQMTLRALAEGVITPDRAEQLCPGCTKEREFEPSLTKKPAGQISAVEVMRLPRAERSRVLAEAAKLAEMDYDLDKDLAEFEALDDKDFDE